MPFSWCNLINFHFHITFGSVLHILMIYIQILIQNLTCLLSWVTYWLQKIGYVLHSLEINFSQLQFDIWACSVQRLLLVYLLQANMLSLTQWCSFEVLLLTLLVNELETSANGIKMTADIFLHCSGSTNTAWTVMRLRVVFASCYPKQSFNKGVVKTVLSYGSECEHYVVCI